MTGVTIFIAGLVIGLVLGVWAASLMVAASDADDNMHEFFEKKDTDTRDESNDQPPTK